ncbi:flagellin N-terminal helical domain-containing protein [Methylobacterium brachiatum]|jgi:flagellin|uniref:Flagellin n=1 Tax=Methylobacterium brachiatum TaxID=269660 RepID=A0AAJ1TJP8_9HYPH|nr:flagellin [Methylobacterium brachiatum]MCB4803451.1 flagellar protein [Methylobacterium brachiatum]MDQ0541886.1 flagellin-like hook-associated protein FlgL [Methylobacterium brachiatum]
MSSSVTLTAATRQNLLSLQDTASLTATTQNRLSTGLKVSSALDNPVSFFTSQALSQRSGDLGNLLDGISNGIQSIQAANQGITSIQKLVDQAKSVANQALSTQITTTGTASTAYSAASASTVNLFVNGAATSVALATTDTLDGALTKLNAVVGAGSFTKSTDGTKIVMNASSDVEFASAGDQTILGFSAGTAASGPTYGTTTAVGQSSDLSVSGVSARATLASQYNSLLTQIDQLAGDSSFNGTNLINGKGDNNNLTINFNPKGNSNLTVTATDETSSGLGLTSITSTSTKTSTVGQGNFLLNADINTTLNKLTTASSQLRTDASTFGSNLSVVQNRQDFSKNLINVLDTGSSNLTAADLNQEAANSQALSTRQSLGISALSLANQAQQGILQLLR